MGTNLDVTVSHTGTLPLTLPPHTGHFQEAVNTKVLFLPSPQCFISEDHLRVTCQVQRVWEEGGEDGG